MDTSVKEYWNNVQRATKSSHKVIYDNFKKRRVLLEALLRYPLHDAKIVELGTGLGLTAHAINLICGRIFYTGIDISDTYAEIARKAFQLKVIVQDFNDGLSVQDHSSDCLFAFDVLEHVKPEDRSRLFREIDRILNDDRIIFINNPISESKHDPEFDFEFNESDIAELCKITNTKIIEAKILEVGYYKYQFFAIGRMGK